MVVGRQCWARGRSEIWNELPVRVRVGAFTRLEHISFEGAFVIHSYRSNCYSAR